MGAHRAQRDDRTARQVVVDPDETKCAYGFGDDPDWRQEWKPPEWWERFGFESEEEWHGDEAPSDRSGDR